VKVISISDTFGPFCIASDDGGKLYGLIVDAIKDDQTVELDFTNIEVLVASFLNGALAPLYRDYDSIYLTEHLKFAGLTPSFIEVIQAVVDNAKRYYRDDAYRKAQDEALRLMSEGD